MVADFFLPSKSFETSLPNSAVTRSRMASLSSLQLESALESDISIFSLISFELHFLTEPKYLTVNAKKQRNESVGCFPLFLAELVDKVVLLVRLSSRDWIVTSLPRGAWVDRTPSNRAA